MESLWLMEFKNFSLILKFVLQIYAKVSKVANMLEI